MEKTDKENYLKTCGKKLNFFVSTSPIVFKKSLNLFQFIFIFISSRTIWILR